MAAASRDRASSAPTARATGPHPAGGRPWRAPAPPRGTTRIAASLAAARELFLRDRHAGDPRRHGGDGLGPYYNATSCVACHGLEAPAGRGRPETNVDLLNLARFPKP